MQTNVHIDTKNLRPSPEHRIKGSGQKRTLEVSVIKIFRRSKKCNRFIFIFEEFLMKQIVNDICLDILTDNDHYNLQFTKVKFFVQ